MTWQLAVDCHDPARLAAFWADALGYVPQPPPEGHASWLAFYRSVHVPEEELVGLDEDYNDRLEDPAGEGPPIWFQPVPEDKVVKNRIHFDVYPGGRDRTMSVAQRVPIVEARVAELVLLGASMVRRFPDDFGSDGEDHFFVTMADPEGNEFCVA